MRNPVLLPLSLAAACVWAWAGAAMAQTSAAPTPPPPPPASRVLPPQPAASPSTTLPAAEGVQWVRKVSEDDQVRIEEVKSRGETLRVTVHLKGSGREYDIVPPSGAHDPSQRHKTPAGSALFRLLSF